MAVKVLDIKIFSPLKLHHSLKEKYRAICHYSYNLSLCGIKKTKLSREINIK